jgi:hypothetical protein
MLSCVSIRFLLDSTLPPSHIRARKGANGRSTGFVCACVRVMYAYVHTCARTCVWGPVEAANNQQHRFCFGIWRVCVSVYKLYLDW